MAEYPGRISDYGDEATRKNEITADDVAELRYFIIGHDYGVMNAPTHIDEPLKCSIAGDNEVSVNSGAMFAYGYVGFFPKQMTLTFLPPSVTQYHIIYAELNRSVVPNTAKIKTKNNQSSPNILSTTLRQDVLSEIKTGVFQLPLALVTVSSLGVEGVKDLREMRNNISLVEESNSAGTVTDVVESDVTGTTTTTSSKKIATTAGVESMVNTAINQ